MSGQVNICGQQDGLASKRNRVIPVAQLGKPREVLGRVKRERVSVGVRVVPAGVGGAVPGVDGALGLRDGGREERDGRKREGARERGRAAG